VLKFDTLRWKATRHLDRQGRSINPTRTKLPRPMLGADIDVDAVSDGDDVFHSARALGTVER
jgi:hypothetical protein